MALEGSLKEFNLADILQLIYFQRKTGALMLQGRFDKVRLLFHEGNIVGAESRKRDVGNRLGRMLIGRSIISQAEIDSVLAKQKESGGKFGALLVQEGYATAEQIVEILQFQITETLVQLFSWKEGRYEFLPQVIPLEKDIPVVVNTEHFLMEGLRFVDEWSTIKDRINLDTVFDIDGEFRGKLNPEEEKLYPLVNGENDVGMISDLTGIDSFQISITLLGMVEKGAIEYKGEEEEFEIEEVKKEKKPIPGLNYIMAVLLLIAFCASVAVTVMFAENRLALFGAHEEMDAMRLKLRTMKHQIGAYPATIEETDHWGNTYIYEAGKDGFSLKSAGPDGMPGTDDDIL